MTFVVQNAETVDVKFPLIFIFNGSQFDLVGLRTNISSTCPFNIIDWEVCTEGFLGL